MAASSQGCFGWSPRLREFRINVAASWRLEDSCLRRARALLWEPGLWEGIPLRSCTTRSLSLAFTMLSRFYTVHVRIVVPRQVPIKLSVRLLDPGEALWLHNLRAYATSSPSFRVEYGNHVVSTTDLAVLSG